MAVGHVGVCVGEVGVAFATSWPRCATAFAFFAVLGVHQNCTYFHRKWLVEAKAWELQAVAQVQVIRGVSFDQFFIWIT